MPVRTKVVQMTVNHLIQVRPLDWQWSLKMSTNIFQKEVGSFLKENFTIAARLDDSFKNKTGGFQVTKKPYDFYGATFDGKHWGAEAKMVKKTRFPIRNLELHQRDALSSLEDNNCLAFLFINWRYKLSGKTIWITFSEYSEIEYMALCNNIKSLTPDNFDTDWFLKRQSGKWIVPENHKLYGIING